MRIPVIGASLGLCLTIALPAVSQAESVPDLLPAADLAKGEKAFNKCKSCHSVEKSGKKGVGPNLYGIVGAPVAAVDGFKYSDALTAYGGEWSVERLDAFLTRPKAEVKGTKMTFSGMKNTSDRANLIAFLNQNSDSPLGFDGETPVSQEATEQAYEFGILFDAPGVEETFYACSACHSEMIVAQQGLTRRGWEELLDWMVEDQGMNEIEEPDLSIILSYLAEHYGEDRPNFPGKIN